jgi:DMSO/TMAO reductase YedYZ heme-binding membrane subunit
MHYIWYSYITDGMKIVFYTLIFAALFLFVIFYSTEIAAVK